MLKKRIKYTDYNGENREEDFYFNLSKVELMEMEMSEDGGLSAHIKKIVDSKDNKAIIKEFKSIITKSYGVKSTDGKRFEKSEELTTAFTQTEAFSELFIELATDANAAAVFINGIVPQTNKIAERLNN